jgi:hypothetical protein
VSEAQRRRIGAIGIGAGAVLFFVGVFAAHFTGLPPVNNVGVEIYPHIPRCMWFEDAPSCWVIPEATKTLAFLGSQIALAAYVFGWIWKQKMTWALATISAFLFTLELIILLGIVPNEFLGLAQGTLAWTDQKVALTIPRWLVLNNDVKISFAVLKDVIAAGYSTTVLIAVAVGAYQLQERAKKADEPKPVVVSGYGRPIVKGER